MASSTSRDIELKLKVATLGAEGIKELENDIRQLAADGKIAADAGGALADEIARLGANAAKVQELGALARDVDSLALASERSRVNTMALAEELTQLNTATKEATRVEQLAADQLEATRAALQAKRDEIALNRTAEEKAKVTADAYKATLDANKAAVRDLIAQVQEQTKTLQVAQDMTAAAASEELAHAKALDAAAKSADATAAALSQRNEQMRAAQSELQEAGVATENLAAAEIALSSALNGSIEGRQRLIALEEQRVQAMRDAELEEERLSGIMLRSRLAMEDAAKAEADGIVADFERMQAAERAAAQQAQEAATAISDAFGTLGTRSVASLNEEIERVRAAMVTLQNTAGLSGEEIGAVMAAGNQRIAELERGVRAATGSLTLMDRAAGALKETWAQVALGFGAQAVGQKLIEWTTEAARGFVTANVALQTMRLGLTAVYKDSGLAAQQIDFLRQVADRAGVSTASISETFVKFSASMKASNIPLAQSNALFAAITQAAGTLGLNGDKVSHMLDALSQMAGKGVVSMEELRQQLGDSLPGAMSLTAQGLGITEAQLIKLVESGGLAARDLFPALTKSLQSMSGEVDTLGSKWERFENVLTQSAQAAGDSGWMQMLALGLKLLGLAAGTVIIPLASLSEMIFGVAKAGGVLLAAIATWTNPMQALGQIYTDGATRLNGLIDKFDAFLGLTDPVAQGATKVGNAIGGTGASVDAANTSMVKLQVQYAELVKAQETAVEVADKHAKAVEHSGAAALQLAKLTGDLTLVQRTEVQVAQANADAAERSASAKEALVATLQKERDQIVATAAANGEDAKAREAQIKAIDEKILKTNAEVESAKTAAEAARVGALAARVAADATKDHAGRVDELRSAMEMSVRVQQETQLLAVNGKRTQDDVNKATEAAVEATARYHDALADQVAMQQRVVSITQADGQLRMAGLQLALAEAKASEDKARLMGNEYGVRQAQIAQVQIELQMAKLKIEITNLEANAMDMETESRIQELIAMGKYTPAMEAEIELRRKKTELMRLQADASKAGIANMEEELRRLKLGIDTRKEGVAVGDALTGSIKGEAGARGMNTAALDAETQAIYARNKAALDELYTRNKIKESTTTADGFTKNKDGSASGTFANGLPVDLATKLKDTGGSGMSADDINTAITQADNAYQDMQAFLKLNPGAASTAYVQSTTALKNAANLARQKQGAGTMTGSGTGLPSVGTGASSTPGTMSATPTPRAAVSATAPAGTTHTVNINLNGNTTAVNVASQTDADNLTAMLKQLETSSKSAA